jgi:hypothetical protein
VIWHTGSDERFTETIDEIYKLAFATWEPGNADRIELLKETLDLYERLTIIAPSDSLAPELLKDLE